MVSGYPRSKRRQRNRLGLHQLGDQCGIHRNSRWEPSRWLGRSTSRYSSINLWPGWVPRSFRSVCRYHPWIDKRCRPKQPRNNTSPRCRWCAVRRCSWIPRCRNPMFYWNFWSDWWSRKRRWRSSCLPRNRICC